MSQEKQSWHELTPELCCCGQADCERAGLPPFAAAIATDWAALALGSGQAAAGHDERTRLEEEVATGLAKSPEWPVRFSTEVLAAASAAAEYVQVRQLSCRVSSLQWCRQLRSTVCIYALVL
jgi:hypothetical protein